MAQWTKTFGRWRKSPQGRLATACLCALLAFLQLRSLGEADRIKERGVPTEATVLDVYSLKGKTVSYEFKVGEETFSGSARFRLDFSEVPTVGEKLKIFYLEENPRSNVPERTTGTAIYELGTLAVIVLFGIYHLVRALG